MANIDGTRLLADLHELRSYGASGGGVVRPSYSEQDMAARAWLTSRMADAGLDSFVDDVGNAVGVSPNTGPTLLVGSHSDTQPTGGWLDGALGVIYGLEVARALLEDQHTRHLSVDAVAWIDEESTYARCVGSKQFCGVLEARDLASRNRAGEQLADAIARNDLGSNRPYKLDTSRHVGYLEAHIEQGPRLEEVGHLIGAVTSIVGIRAVKVTFSGQQNHAGTTPMHLRADAGVALFDYAARLRERFSAVATGSTVWTFGNAVLEPGAESIVPGRAQLTAQFRDPDDELLTAMQNEMESLAREMSAEGPVGVSVIADRDGITPTMMSPALIDHVAQAAELHAPGKWMQMPSAAGHDPMVISHHLPCGMLFIPSINGISHDFSEDSLEDDIIRGCQVLADAVVAALGSAPG